MRRSRLVVLVLVGLAAAGCMRRNAPLAAQGYGAPAPVVTGALGAPADPPPAYAPPAAYTLDAGDRLRVAVFGQDGLSGPYAVDAGGNVAMPLVGIVPARGLSTHELARAIADRLRQGYLREPHVSVEIEAYRPFFILGEVTTPGQYPYVANMTAETAVAIAGGYSPRARKGQVQLSRVINGQVWSGSVPAAYPLAPGDTVTVKERWF
jgi:polysaccharide export outer membrane protein